MEYVVTFHEGEPPKNGRTYLLKFIGGIMCTGSYRYGKLGEPQQEQAYWRCDCCGKYAMPIAWARIEETINVQQDIEYSV